MPINPNLLIASPTLQDALIDDATGLPLSDGVVTLYQDNSRTTFKNWYYQSGSPGAYTYITLPNPLTLSSVGTIVDNNGNDTIPFFYPVSEVDNTTRQTYYITVDNSNGQRQFVRQNFPFVPGGSGPTPGDVNPTLVNYVANNTFWRNIGSVNASAPTNTYSFNGDTYYYETVAPSNHDGFNVPDMVFVKNEQNGTDTVSFPKFTLGSNVLPNGITPEFYCNINCSGAGTETVKFFQWPIDLHIQNLSGVDASVVFWAQNNGGTNNIITVSILQYLGTGVNSSPPATIQTITLTNDWEQYVIPFTFQSALGQIISSSQPNGASDDAYFLQINLPTAQTCNVNFAGPSVYLSGPTQIPTNAFQTYDQVDSIINTPRTGDARISINGFVPYGWVAANDGVIAATNQDALTNYSRANQDTFPLYNLLWNIAKPYDSGSGGNFNPICQMYTSAGAATDFGSTAIGDFNAAKAIALTRAFGRVILGTAPISSLLSTQSTTFTASSSSGLLITTANNVSYFNGMPIVFTNTGGALPTGLVANAVYYVSNFNGTNAFNVSTSFSNAITGSVIAYTNAGSGTNTVTSAIIGSSEGEYAHTQLQTELANHSHAAAGTPTGGTPSFVVDHSSGPIQITGTGGTSTSRQINTASTGSSTPFNVTQPGTFYNIYVKL